MKDISLEDNDYPRELWALQKELTSSLKFHHGQTFKTLPLDLAIQALVEAWQACNKNKQN